MFLEKPSINEYVREVDELADIKFQRDMKKNALEHMVATCVRIAQNRMAKTREMDVVKVLGNDDKEGAALESLRQEIYDLEKRISKKYGKVNAWVASKDLYISDNYHQMRGFNAGKLGEKDVK